MRIECVEFARGLPPVLATLFLENAKIRCLLNS